MSPSPTPPDMEAFRIFAHALADAAAPVTLKHFRAGGVVDNKNSGGGAGFDPVTEADTQAETVMRELITAAWPDHGIMGEEHGTHAGAGQWQWILDPVDGTRAFIIGAPTWGTLIALHDGTRAVLGLMDQPFTGDRFEGSGRDAVLVRGGRRTALRTRPCADVSHAILASSSPDMFTRPDEKEAFRALSRRVRMRRFGMDCYAYCLLAMGLVDVIVETGMAPYDIQPLIPIVEGAGGRVSDWRGRPLTGGGQVIAAGDPAAHAACLDILAPAARQG